MSEWVSVEERLPEESDRVLVTYIDSIPTLSPLVEIAYRCERGGPRKGIVWFEDNGDDLEYRRTPTHWMPLPKPPEMDEHLPAENHDTPDKSQ